MLRIVLFIPLFCLLSWSPIKAQSFSLTDTTFELGDVLTTDIYFDYNGAGILKKSYPFLDSLSTFLQTNRHVTIEVGNHTDHRGNAKYNLRLSEMRAKTIQFYLTSKGVHEAQLRAEGFGEGKPIIPIEEVEQLKDPEEREKAFDINRRTEFTIVKMD